MGGISQQQIGILQYRTMITDHVNSNDKRRKLNDAIDMMSSSGYRRDPGPKTGVVSGGSSNTATVSITSAISPFPIGSRVVINNLQRQTILNGHLAIVEEYMEKEGRFKVRPLGRQGKLKTKSKFLSINGRNLRIVQPSSFVARIRSYSGRMLQLPLVCRIELDHSSEDRLAVRLMYSDWGGIEKVTAAAKEIEGDNFVYSGHESSAFGVVTTPFSEEDLRGQSLDGDEVLILYDKPAIRDLYDAMVDYELVQELEVMVDVGLLGSFPLCRLIFPYEVEQN